MAPNRVLLEYSPLFSVANFGLALNPSVDETMRNSEQVGCWGSETAVLQYSRGG